MFRPKNPDVSRGAAPFLDALIGGALRKEKANHPFVGVSGALVPMARKKLLNLLFTTKMSTPK